MFRKEYSTKTVGKSRIIALIALMVVMAALIIADGVVMARETPANWDVSHPMVNAHVSWEQTYYGGGKK